MGATPPALGVLIIVPGVDVSVPGVPIIVVPGVDISAPGVPIIVVPGVDIVVPGVPDMVVPGVPALAPGVPIIPDASPMPLLPLPDSLGSLMLESICVNGSLTEASPDWFTKVKR